MSRIARAFSVICLFGLWGCADVSHDEEVGASAEPLVGSWQSGNVSITISMTQSDDAFVKLCEVMDGGMYHPGKFYSNACHYEYDGGVRASSTYMMVNLSLYANMQWETSSDGCTDNHYFKGSWPGSLPVCKAGGGFGKVWGNQCLMEYGNAKLAYNIGTFQCLWDNEP